MKPNIAITVTVGALRSMNDKQFEALKENVLNDKKWETADGLQIWAPDEIGVAVMKDGERMIYMGIEKDGYTHS